MKKDILIQQQKDIALMSKSELEDYKQSVSLIYELLPKESRDVLNEAIDKRDKELLTGDAIAVSARVEYEG